MNNIFKKIYLILNGIYRNETEKKNSYSLGGVDLLVNYIFRDKKNGIYIDVGCNHPIKNNNTYLLHKRGWSGINIDLDDSSIEQFKLFRSNDVNIASCVSNNNGITDLYFYHDKSPINTINKNLTLYHQNKPKKIKSVKTKTLASIFEDTKFKNEKVNFLSIDTEGNELEVLEGFNLNKYYPDIIVVEFLDLKIKKLELVNQNISSILDSKIYKYMIKNKYHLVNFVHSDLVFASENIRDS
jgi:FkbM family methyltransferase